MEEPTMEGLLEKMATIERRLKQVFKMFKEKQTTLNQVLEENMALKNSLKDLHDRIKKKWGVKVLEKILKESQLAELSRQEKELKLTVEELKRSIVGPIKASRNKQEEEVRKLRKLVATMMADKSDASKLNDEGQESFSGTAGNDAIEVFPREMWELILQKVSDPQDLWNCCNACSLFEDILHQWKTGWLLEQALPNMYRYLPTNKLLELRLVSKGWNSVVDNFLEDHPSLRPHGDKRDPRSLDFVCPLMEKRIIAKNFFVFNNKECFTLENSKLPLTRGRNPIVGRYVCLDIGRSWSDRSEAEDGNEIQYWEKLYEFLATVGKEIWYMFVAFPYRPTSAYMINEVIQFSTVKLFKLCPNLRKFSMDHTLIPAGNWRGATFPSAPKLETICAMNNYTLNDFVLDAILKRNHMQLRKLVLTRQAWSAIRHLEWPNLAELMLAYPCFDQNLKVQDLKHLVGIRAPRLTKVALSLCGLVKAGLTYEYLLAVINEVMSTTPLTTLRLRGLGKMKVGHTPRKESSLKSLELQDCCLPPSFDFLFGCFPFLENLTVFGRKLPAGLEENDMKNNIPEISLGDCGIEVGGSTDDGILELRKFMCGGEMYKSNIWEFLPLLKVFTYQWDVYTREGYEAYSRNLWIIRDEEALD